MTPIAAETTPMGGEGKIVEADEAYLGKAETPILSESRKCRPLLKRDLSKQKHPIFALVERSGQARAFHVKHVTANNLKAVLLANVDTKSRLHINESRLYPTIAKAFATHETVQHGAGEYARGDVTTNSVEGFFGVLKRSMKGVYQHCDEQHFQRYLNEFAFRHNRRIKLSVNDDARATVVIRGAGGKRLTYRGNSFGLRHLGRWLGLLSVGFIGRPLAIHRFTTRLWLWRGVQCPPQRIVATFYRRHVIKG